MLPRLLPRLPTLDSELFDDIRTSAGESCRDSAATTLLDEPICIAIQLGIDGWPTHGWHGAQPLTQLGWPCMHCGGTVPRLMAGTTGTLAPIHGAPI